MSSHNPLVNRDCVISEYKTLPFDKLQKGDYLYEYDEFIDEVNDVLFIEKHKYLICENNEIYKFLDSKSFDNGTYTHVYKIKKIKPYNKKIYILRLFEEDDHLLEKYKVEKQIFGHNIIKIYHFGRLRDKYNIICNYVITELYHTKSDILKLDSSQRINLYSRVISLVRKANRYNYFLRDLKIANMGYKKRYNKIIPVIIDYDKDTFIKYEDLEKENIYRRFLYGTLIHPTILLYNTVSSNTNFTKRIVYDLYKMSLMEILLMMFSDIFKTSYNIEIGNYIYAIYDLTNKYFNKINKTNTHQYIDEYNSLISKIQLPYIEKFLICK